MRAKILPILAVALLLLQLPITAPVFAGFATPGHDGMAMDAASEAAHPCHPDPSGTPSCEDRGCIFCGLVTPAEAPRIQNYLAYLLYSVNDAVPATPRFEQTVELRPPKNSHYA